ncbi:MAG: hypothetical protein KDD53_06460 [Bdellovibrionales bacterium]|nr:hypothetical protein [Bdellovibrionales bacterium]
MTEAYTQRYRQLLMVILAFTGLLLEVVFFSQVDQLNNYLELRPPFSIISSPRFLYSITIFSYLCFLFLLPKLIDQYLGAIVSVVSTVVFLGILEGATKVVYCNFADRSFVQLRLLPGECNLSATYQGHHYLNHAGTPNYFSSDKANRHNSLGFRGPDVIIPKPKGRLRIVLLGGSTTYTERVRDWHNDIARVLESELRAKMPRRDIEVINAGMSSYSSFESLINLEFKVLDLHPDIIVVYHGTNDVHTRLVPPSKYASDNSALKRQWAEPQMPLILRSAIVRLVFGPLITNLGRFIDKPHNTIGIKSSGVNSDLGGTPKETLLANPPIYFERNIRSMIAIANANNIESVLMTFAWNPDFHDYASSEHYQFAFKEQNQILRNITNELGVSLFDYSNLMSQDPNLWADGVHLNEKGVTEKARLLGEFLYSNFALGENDNAPH